VAGNLGHFVLLYALDVVVGQRPRVDPIPYWYDTLRYGTALSRAAPSSDATVDTCSGAV
jgi:hypothetical protein